MVEWPASAPPRLVPITILVDGRYYDAGIYKATPIPMALEPETVYEVTETGESVGLFVITGARQSKDLWYAEGAWRANQPPATAAAKANAPVTVPGSEDEPPRLRHPGEKSSPPAKPETAKPSAAAPPSQPAPPPAPAGDDTDRPILRRGAPKDGTQAASLPGPVEVPKGAAAVSESARGLVQKGSTSTVITRVLPAVSDATSSEFRSYKFDWRPDEQKRLTAAIEKLAASSLEKYASARAAHRPGKLEAVHVRAFDLDLSNEPELVLTARAPEAPVLVPGRKSTAGTAAPPVPSATKPFTYFVTVVARVDLNGELRPALVSVTDTQHLVVVSRMELLDAVDADGDGHGELLFREIWDLGRNFALYRVDPDRAVKLFSGPVE